MSPYRYRICFRAHHPSADVAPLFDQLGWEPDHLWVAGQSRQTALGAPLAGVYPDSYGSVHLTPEREPREWSQESLEQFLDALQRRLAAHRIVMREFNARGGRCGLSIGMSGQDTFGFELSPQLHRALAELELSLGFDIQPSDAT